MQYILASAAQHVEFCRASTYFTISKEMRWLEDFLVSRLWR